MSNLAPTIALNLIVMGATMAALHRALRWSVEAIHRARLQTQASRVTADVQPGLSLVETEDRRTHQLPFVGQDRRTVAEATREQAAELNGTTGTASNVKPFKRP